MHTPPPSSATWVGLGAFRCFGFLFGDVRTNWIGVERSLLLTVVADVTFFITINEHVVILFSHQETWSYVLLQGDRWLARLDFWRHILTWLIDIWGGLSPVAVTSPWIVCAFPHLLRSSLATVSLSSRSERDWRSRVYLHFSLTLVCWSLLWGSLIECWDRE